MYFWNLRPAHMGQNVSDLQRIDCDRFVECPVCGTASNVNRQTTGRTCPHNPEPGHLAPASHKIEDARSYYEARDRAQS